MSNVGGLGDGGGGHGVSPDGGVAPSRMVGVPASVNLPLHHKVQKFYSGTISRGWSRRKGRKRLCGLVNSVKWRSGYWRWSRELV